MPKRNIPNYRLHKATGQAFVELGGRRVYLGKHGSKASREEYERRIAEYLANGRQLPPTMTRTWATCQELAVRFLEWAEEYFMSQPKSFVHAKKALGFLVQHYGREPVDNFGPSSLVFVQKKLVEHGYARLMVNRYVAIIKQAFKHGAKFGWANPQTSYALQVVDNLKKGRTKAHEYREIKPADPDDFEKTMAALPKRIADMARIQRLCVMRPQDVCNLRLVDIDRSRDVWLYRPHAVRCVDKDSIKSALAGICLRGATSQIVSTTGAQLLAQDGFVFDTWGKSDVICPFSKIFSSKDLAAIDAEEIELGLEEDHVYFRLGNVEFWLKAIDGTFPKVEQLLVPADGTTYLNFHPTDIQFILDRIEKLPGAKDSESPLYFHINKAVQARAHDIAHKTGIALEFSHSRFTGEPVDVAMNRHFLKNALQFGCWTMGIDPTGDKAVIFKGDDKTFVCMPLSGTEPEATHMDVITSASQPTVTASKVSATTSVPATAPAPVKRRRRTVKRSTVAQPAGKIELLKSAEQIRNDLRNSLLQVNSLIREVKSQRQKDKLLHSTMESLRKLSLA